MLGWAIWLLLPPPGSIDGRLVDLYESRPLPGIAVQLTTREDRTERQWTTTAADGSFRFEGLAPGEYRIRLRKDRSNLWSVLIRVRRDGEAVHARAIAVDVWCVLSTSVCAGPGTALNRAVLPDRLTGTQDGEPLPIGLCELLRGGAELNRRLITVRGRVAVDEGLRELTSAACSGGTEQALWLDYEGGLEALAGREATLTGRVEALSADGFRRAGFGHLGQYRLRLVVTSATPQLP